MNKKTLNYVIGGGVLYIIGYYVWKHYQKKPTVLVSGSSNDTPDNVKYATGKELNANGERIYDTNSGTIDTLINLKKPIYIKPTNSIPNVYDNNIGLEVNCSGYMNAAGGVIQKNCNKVNLGQKSNGTQLPLDLPKIA
jgi:hypothetical protein